MYCVKCKKKTSDGPVTIKKTKNGRLMKTAKCEVCGTMKHVFVKKDEMKGGCDCQEGEGIGDVIERIKAFFQGPRNNYSPSIRKLLPMLADKKILSIQICRSPIQSFIQKIIDIVKIKETPYDKFFHLYGIIKLDDGQSYRFEKNQVIEITKSSKETDSDCVPASGSGILFGEFFMKAQQSAGETYFKYDGFTNNCQDFIITCLKANGILTAQLTTFIKQDASKLVPPLLETLGKKVTDLAGAADVLVHGEGKKKRKRKSI